MYVFIINPAAGKHRGRQIFTDLTKTELYHQINSKHFFTEYPNHAEEIAEYVLKMYRNEIKAVIVIGGDGTLHEVMNGLVKNELQFFLRGKLPIGFIRAGSGNDFARGVQIKGSHLEVFQKIILQEETVPYWLGTYCADDKHKRLFVNSIGFGFDAEVARKANQSSYKRLLNLFRLGTVSYIIALLQILRRYEPMNIELKVNGAKRIINNCWMITITNHPFYGGGMKIIPDAKIQPSTFPVLIIHSISRWKILGLFMTVFFGQHMKFKEVEWIEASEVTIRADREITYQTDGETAACQSCVITKQSDAIDLHGTG